MTDRTCGERFYSKTYENPKGVPEDLTRCVEKVWDARWNGEYARQCSRKRGHGRDGILCKQHAKVEAKYFDPHRAGG